MQFKSFIAGSLLATSALAATANTTAPNVPSACNVGSSATFTAQTDFDKISTCENVVGNISVTGDLGSAALSNVKNLYGSLTIFNATSLSLFSADSLEMITGTLSLRQLTILTSASFGSLAYVDSINLVTLPAIDNFASALKNANIIYISDTTLANIDGFSTLDSVQSFNVNNNRQLTSVASSLRTVSEALEFSSNGNNATVVFDNLVWANNITLRDVSSASFATLKTVNASLGFINNSLPIVNLTQLGNVGASLSFVSNDQLSTVNCKNLTTIGGGFVIANNTELQTIDGFKKLSTVGGAIDIEGNFSSLDLGSLRNVRGGATFDTSASNFSCSSLNQLQSNGNIQGDFSCKAATTTSSSSSMSSTSSSGSSRSSSTRSSSSTASVNEDAASSSSTTSSTKSSKSKGDAGHFAPSSSFMGVVGAIALALF
ncbi:hypothetical protein Kpol_1052p7 [Vanderwaltozyma polyspora DSM 70294]|uniref:Uncharacterized protein n=1 Tax=Vanderwaltozyma polyspora (strain ATCC 22028 / DSM 70294 / BCRC 21397 / CBS 2163 / NBRC 10782 / NRRL Y-8283 / UCD 57-17) TaxID=436907 RepID=A7TM18_VANPO|nr:uncharacterized protein Kpol_1052p7 [Vanderwaltozyma polyspora DSM 70294]EDO16660.1 hypothetical protein Kpol_1052p7 [Vanderwaltozyma polyspora DSM 70294]